MRTLIVRLLSTIKQRKNKINSFCQTSQNNNKEEQ